MSESLEKFTHFGNIGTTEQRQRLIKHLLAHLKSGGRVSFEFSDLNLELWNRGLKRTLANQTLLELCDEDSDFSERVAGEILNNLHATQRILKLSTSPHAEELTEFEKFRGAHGKNLMSQWKDTKGLLESIYLPKDLDTAFYDRELQSAFASEEGSQKFKKKTSYDSIKSHLNDRWQALLDQKILAHQLDLIEKERVKFVKDLYARAEELKKLKEALEPFTQELGRLWDMSKGNWHRVNFDLLKQYAALLQQNEALQQLAEMLGKMRKAEALLEEELYKDIEIKTVWKVERAQKSELVGIKESDDLNNLLPGETALLADPDLELLFYKRFAEKKLQVYDFQGKMKDIQEKEVERQRFKSQEDKKGPIIICVDTSGSMHGAPETVAKTLCFAILKIALQERRKCYLISFSTGISTLDLTDFQHSLDKLLDFLGMSFHGGTDASPALQESLRMLERESYDKADVLMISDFVMNELGAALLKNIADAKTKETKFHSLVIGASHNTGIIQQFDHNWIYDPAHPDALKTLLMQMREL